jgi:hypothetical protein
MARGDPLHRPLPWHAMTSCLRPAYGALALGIALLALGPFPARASSLDDIRRLEELINAAGTETIVATDCPPDHAGYYENDGRKVDRLVICRGRVDLGDSDAVWEVMAH